MLNLMQLSPILIPALIMLLPVFIIVLGLTYLRKSKRVKRRNPISDELLRGPGESLRKQIDDVSLDLITYVSFASTYPLFVYAIYLNYVQTSEGHKFTNITLGYFLLIGIAGIVYIGYKLCKFIKLKRNLSLGYDAELAVGQELNAMTREGYWIFHDFPAENYNIDHVLVGPAGVYAIETKGRAKPIKSDGKPEYKVIYDGKKLSFPSWTESEPLEQAIRQASSLQIWLSSAVGETILVKPVLMLPGWFIDRTSASGILVLNGKNANSLLGKVSGNCLSEVLLKRIVHQLDQRCRTVKPVNIS